MDHNLHDDDQERASRLLGALAPGPAHQPDPRRALARLKLQFESERKDEFTMFGIRIPRKFQKPLAAAVTIAVLAGLLAIPQVRAFASGVLNAFRVQRFVLVDVSPERLEAIQKAVGDKQDFGQRETLKDGGEPQAVASLDKAAKLAGFTPLQADKSYGDPTKVEVSGESVMRYRPDVKAMREVFSALELDPELLPANIDGQPFDITVPAGISAAYGKPGKGYGLVQMPSPTVDVPKGVDMQKLGEAMLQVLGMSPQEAARMSAHIDWATTLIVPVPSDLRNVREVTVRGTTGLLYSGSGKSGPPDGEAGQGGENYTVTVVWQAGGNVYVALGYNETRVLAFAESLK